MPETMALPRKPRVKIARAAEILGVSEKTMERYVAQRRVPAYALPPAREGKKGTRGTKPILTFDEDELIAFAEQFRIGPRLVRKVG